MMKGIHFVTDPKGKRTAVQINLEDWGDIWEDIYDVLISESRKGEPRVPWSVLKREMGSETRGRKKVSR
ncbi:MAG TPA: hypothetical protein VF398_05955 [bacterium]|jgi:hypothetical protein